MVKWIALAAVAAASLLLAACDDDDESARPSPTPEPGIRIGAPPDCRANPFCLPGLAREYGADATANFVAVDPGPAMESALRSGAIDVGVFFSTDPVPESNQWTRLIDDRGMVGAEHVIPILKVTSAEALGPAGIDVLNRVSATLTSDQLKALVGATDIAGEDLETLAVTWVDNNLEGLPEVVLDRPFIIHTGGFTESRAAGELYAAALRRAGATVVVEENGFRVEMLNDIVFGETDMIPEFAASALRFVSGYGSLATGDKEETVALLREYVGVRDLVALEPSPAESVNTFVVTARTADDLGIDSLSDLAALLPPATGNGDGPDEEPDVPPGSGADDIGVGSSGEPVRRVQLQLIALGYNPGLADGEFGEETRLAVVQFQEHQGLRPDGVVGPQTAAELDREVAAALDQARATPTPPPPLPTIPPPPPPPPPLSTPSGDRVVYLTFDDGPHSQFTAQVLDVLARHNARGTFFVLGQAVTALPDLSRRIIAEGHGSQNHTWDHPDLAGIGQTAFNAQIVPTNDAIVAVGAPQPTCLRPPFGSRDANTESWAAQLGMRLLLWTVDPQDWRRPGADVIASHVIEFARPGAIILFHDGGGDRTQTVQALERILPALAAQGFSFDVIC